MESGCSLLSTDEYCVATELPPSIRNGVGGRGDEEEQRCVFSLAMPENQRSAVVFGGWQCSLKLEANERRTGSYDGFQDLSVQPSVMGTKGIRQKHRAQHTR